MSNETTKGPPKLDGEVWRGRWRSVDVAIFQDGDRIDARMWDQGRESWDECNERSRAIVFREAFLALHARASTLEAEAAQLAHTAAHEAERAGKAEAEVARLRDALVDALEGMQDMRPYVGDFFAEKWGHDDYIARAEAALKGEP